MMMPGLISAEPFVPHSFAHILEKRVFPEGSLPEAAYDKIVKDYKALEDVRVSRITYDSDGLAITGISALPAAITPGGHKLLIYNRGGNREYGKLTVLSVMRSMAPFARKGYLVFASNYRGNDGGEGTDEFGGSDVRDVTRLLEIARQHPGWDGRNVNMLGHSRGGMMTYMAIRAGAKVNAAIVLAGVSDVRQSGGERPEMEQKVFSQLIPGEGVARDGEYEKRSALCWPETLNVPLLLLHGDADKAVDAGHSIRLAAALEALGSTHALHIYPGGNHALIRVWDDVLARCFNWLERWKT